MPTPGVTKRGARCPGDPIGVASQKKGAHDLGMRTKGNC